jgi:hypothetical protein
MMKCVCLQSHVSVLIRHPCFWPLHQQEQIFTPRTRADGYFLSTDQPAAKFYVSGAVCSQGRGIEGRQASDGRLRGDPAETKLAPSRKFKGLVACAAPLLAKWLKAVVCAQWKLCLS